MSETAFGGTALCEQHHIVARLCPYREIDRLNAELEEVNRRLKMKKKDRILTWDERCEVHPHGNPDNELDQMIQDRMQKEIDDLREYIDELTSQKAYILRETLEEIAEPYDYTWYQNADNGDDVVDAMIALARMALTKAGG